MNPVPILPDRLTWASTIGLFLLNFSTLDYLVFVFLKDHLSSEAFDKVRERPFKTRVRKVAKCLKDAGCPAEHQEAFACLIERLEPIRELRNHVAHGHFFFRFDAKTSQLVLTLFKAKDVDRAHLPDATHLEFAELRAASEKLSELVDAFARLAGFGATPASDPAASRPHSR